MNPEAIIFFDGVCNLCNTAVQFIIKRDKKSYFKFASLQSTFTKNLIGNGTISPQHPDSIILLEKGQLSYYSTAALKIAQHLSGGYKILYYLIFIPAPIRDFLYKVLAKNRYKWFGKRTSCMLPTPELKSRFLE